MNTPETPTTTPDKAPGSELEMLIDGTMMTVSFRTSEPGQIAQTERVKVRKIPICDMDELGRGFGKAKQEVSIYCGKAVEWVERLDDDSFAAAMSEGRRLNFTSFKKWFQWQQDTLDAMGQGAALQPILKDALEKLLPQQDGKSGAKSVSGNRSNS